MRTRERIHELHAAGLKNVEIARKIGVSRQWVHYVLTHEERGRGRKPWATPEQLELAQAILNARGDWTYVELDDKLSEVGLDFPFQRVYQLLRETGFVWDRKIRRWFKQIEQ